MSAIRERVADLGWRRILFSIVVLVPLLIYFGLFELWRNQVLLVSSWFGGFGLLEPVFYELPHRLHDFAFAMMFWPLVIGLLAQFRSPKQHVAGMLMALWSPIAFLSGIALTNGWELLPIFGFLGVPTLIASLLHPAGRDLLGSFSFEQINRITLVLVIVAAIPLLAFTVSQVGLQTGTIDPAHDHAGANHDEEVHQDHIEFHHFMFVTAFVIAVIGVALLASLQPPGWWLAAWLTGAMVAVYGLTGLLTPEAASNPGPLWDIAAIIWGIGFVVTAEYTQRPDNPSYFAS